MNKITSLTPLQIARFPEWVNKWVAIGLSTEPADFDRAERAVRACYSHAKLKQPQYVLRFGSPYSATLGGILAVMKMNHKVWEQVGAQVGAQVREQIEAQVEAQVGEQVGAQVGAQVWAQVREQIEAQVEAQVGEQVGAQVWAQVRAQVGTQVREQVWAQVWAQVREQIEAQVEAQVAQCRYAQLWATWYSYISFFRDVLGWSDKSLIPFADDEALALSCGWTWWHDDVCTISNRMSFINRDNRGRLHNTNGPALAYPDGWAIYAVHGVVIPKLIIEYPEQITIQSIESESNAEIRRVMLDKFGWDRYIIDSGIKPVARDQFGVLYRLEIAGDEELVMVKVTNTTPESDGSFREFFLRVDPNAYGGSARKIPRAAIASTWHKEDHSLFFSDYRDYHPDVES